MIPEEFIKLINIKKIFKNKILSRSEFVLLLFRLRKIFQNFSVFITVS
jgi:hypothetical protein